MIDIDESVDLLQLCEYVATHQNVDETVARIIIKGRLADGRLPSQAKAIRVLSETREDARVLGSDVAIMPEFWEIAEIVWEDSFAERLPQHRLSKPSYFDHDKLYQVIYVRVRVSHLLSQWPEKLSTTIDRPSSEPSNQKGRDNTGGRPGKYDWEGALIFIAMKMHFTGVEDRSAITELMNCWFAERDQHPSDSEVRKRAKRIHDEWRRLASD